jgi:hypothetical protein
MDNVTPGYVQLKWMWLVVLIGIFDVRSALADEWRYCLASSRAQNTTYMSSAFLADESMKGLEVDFGRVLDHVHVQYDSVQCLRGDTRSISTIRLQAIRYNRDSGNTVVELDWSPTRSAVDGGLHVGR